MSQSWHPDDSDWRESSEDAASAASLCGVLDRDTAFVPVIIPQKYSDVVAPVPHVVLGCAPDDDDEDGDE